MVPVVLGGDHSIAAGTLSGVAAHFKKKEKRVGLIWLDAHGDINTPETSPSGNVHGMPLAAAMGYGALELVELQGFKPKGKRQILFLLAFPARPHQQNRPAKRPGVH